MNKCFLIGRTTKEIEVRYTQGANPTAVARFTIAINRRKKADGTQDADFITCIAWGKTAELMEQYVGKGDKISVAGRIQTGSYEKDGNKVYTTDVVVEELEFLEKRKEGEHKPVEDPQIPAGFSKLDDDDIPF